MDVILEIKNKIIPGTIIPKPEAKANYVVKGWGKRRGEPALIYQIPNHKNPKKPYEKGITESEWQKVYTRIQTGETFSRKWFVSSMPECNAEGYCNFTTIGGIFQLLGLVDYKRGMYTPRL